MEDRGGLVGGAIESALAALRDRRSRAIEDPLFPIAVLRGDSILGRDGGAAELLSSWESRGTRETGAIRYRWAIATRFIFDWPAWIGSPESWAPWRARDVLAWDQSPERAANDIERLLTPLILADSLHLLSDVGETPDREGEIARRILAEALPKARRDAAGWVLETRAWADTWALWALSRRPGALTLLYPFAAAIGDSYATSARRSRDVVLGTRFPFHGTPLVSASAQLASGLVALGVHPNLAGAMAAWVRVEQHDDGGWGDGDDPSDLLTTLVAADLLAGVDPDYDTASTARWFADRQREDGWWRACGPEASWLTVEILTWLRRADRPFAERFTWPHLAVTNRDRRTGLPFYGYFSDLERLFDAVPGLGTATIDIAFIDLAGFGAFNNAFGMERGDRVLRSFAQALARIPRSMAIRDGGDEFIVLGPPTGTGLSERMAAFRESWAIEFAETFGDGVVAPRVLIATTRGAHIVETRNELGRLVAEVKQREHQVGATGVQVEIGPIGGSGGH